MKNVLVVGDFIKGSGLTNYLTDIYSRVPDTEYKYDYLSYSGDHSLDESIKRKNINKIDITPIRKNIGKHVQEWFFFFKNHRFDYDVIHFNYSASWNFIAVLMAKAMTNSKIIVQSHNNYYSQIPTGKAQKFILSILNSIGRTVLKICADKKLAVSRESADWMFGKKSGNNVFILKNGIDLKKFQFSQQNRLRLRKRLMLQKDQILIGFVGTLEERKNPFYAVDVVKNLDEKYTLAMFGRGPLQKKLEKNINAKRIKNKVKFMGVSDNLNEWYSAFDIFMFPSKTEGFGFALLEAQANGLTCLTSTTIPADAKVTKNALSLDLKNINSWVQAIKDANIGTTVRIINSKQNIKKIKEQGFSIDETSKYFTEILDSLTI